MGATVTKNKIEKINNNQTCISDLVLVQILKYKNNSECRDRRLYNQLSLGLVSSYWMMYIVPKGTIKVSVHPKKCKFLTSFPETLEILYRNQQMECNLNTLLCMNKLKLIQPKDAKKKKNRKVYSKWNYHETLATKWRQLKSLIIVNPPAGLSLKGFNYPNFDFDTFKIYDLTNEFYKCDDHEWNVHSKKFLFHVDDTSYIGKIQSENAIMPFHQSFSSSSNVFPAKYNEEQETGNLERLSIRINIGMVAILLRQSLMEVPLISSFQNLKQLKLDSCYYPREPYISSLRKLEKLSIKGILGGIVVHSDTHEISIISELVGMKQLKVLKLKNIILNKYSELIEAIDNMDKLERFSINNNSASYSSLLYSYLGGNRLVQSIRQLTIKMDDNILFYNMLSNLGCIERLKLTDVENNTMGTKVAAVISENKQVLKVLVADHIPSYLLPDIKKIEIRNNIKF